MDTKVTVRKEAEEAFAILLRICLRLDLPTYYKRLESGRSFIARCIDNSDLPEV